MIDFHGSTGYGQAFTDAINGHWGDRPARRLQKGLAAALEKFPWLDGERVAALGASYGGYMVNWMHGTGPSRSSASSATTATSTSAWPTTTPRSCGSPSGRTAGTPWEQPEQYMPPQSDRSRRQVAASRR
jgi:dipeptidyl aminopeptidase/acylaminoacyl peptidase